MCPHPASKRGSPHWGGCSEMWVHQDVPVRGPLRDLQQTSQRDEGLCGLHLLWMSPCWLLWLEASLNCLVSSQTLAHFVFSCLGFLNGLFYVALMCSLTRRACWALSVSSHPSGSPTVGSLDFSEEAATPQVSARVRVSCWADPRLVCPSDICWFCDGAVTPQGSESLDVRLLPLACLPTEDQSKPSDDAGWVSGPSHEPL